MRDPYVFEIHGGYLPAWLICCSFVIVLLKALCLQSFLPLNMSFPCLINSSSQDFGLTIDIEKLIKETDTDGSGKVDYAEFKAMMA